MISEPVAIIDAALITAGGAGLGSLASRWLDRRSRRRRPDPWEQRANQLRQELDDLHAKEVVRLNTEIRELKRELRGKP